MVDKFGVKGSVCKKWKRVMAECEMNLELIATHFTIFFYRWISMNKDENNLNLLSITNPQKSGQNVLYEKNYIYCFEYNLQW